MKTLLALLITTLPTLAHEAVKVSEKDKGWNYPWACCSNQDCRKLDRKEIKETKIGYEVLPSKDVAAIGYTDKRVKDSPDGDYHWCAHKAGIDAGNTICLFVPPKGF